MENNISKIFGLVLKMAHVHYFTYILFHMYLKITKLVLFETKLNKLSRKKGITQN